MKGIQKTGFRWMGLILGVMAMTMTISCKADSVQVFPEPWQVLKPGKPPENRPTLEILDKGRGAVIEPGDLVQIELKTKWGKPTPSWQSDGDWWLWIGFQDRKSTDFFAEEPWLASAMIGQRQGSILAFIENGKPGRDKEIAGVLRVNPIGDSKHYGWRKGSKGQPIFVYISGHETPSTVEIKRVCKGKAQYRTVRLFDDSYVQRCTWAPLHCEMTKTPREGWIDEAKIEAVCSDGKVATFHYGPVASRNGKQWSGPVNAGNYFDRWITAAWDKLPVGVQLK